MKLKLSLMTIAALAGSAVYADTIAGAGVGTYSVATELSTGTLSVCGATSCTTAGNPYWYNNSMDGAGLAGYNFLTAAAGTPFAGMTNWLGTSGVSYLVAGGDGTPPSFNFVQQAGALSISLIYANSAGTGGAEIGIYNAGGASGSCTAVQNADGVQNSMLSCTPHQILATLPAGAGTGAGIVNADTGSAISILANGASNYANWGLYARTCQTAICQSAFGITTYYQTNADNQYNPSLCPTCATADMNHQHWALFQNTITGVYYLALTDWSYGFNNSTIAPFAGSGDYNDMVFQIATSTPEPSTVSIVGLGLAGLLAYARKFRK